MPVGLRARPSLVGTPGKYKTPNLLRTFSQLGEYAPGMSLDGRSWLKVRTRYGVCAPFECQVIWDVLYLLLVFFLTSNTDLSKALEPSVE